MIIDNDFYLPIIEELFRVGAIDYTYDKIRCDEYDELLDSLMVMTLPTLHPTFVQVSGIPGSGKSTFCGRQYPNALLVQFDSLMMNIKSYQTDCQCLGLAEAFSKWEMPARVIGYELIRRLIAQKVSFVLEHSGVNPAHVKLINVLKKQGYQTQMQFLECDLSEACRRVEEREKKISRHTPKSLIEQRAKASKDYLEQYKKITDDVFVWNLTNVEDWKCLEHWSQGVLNK